jgi:asparagine synthase (glutamine-hydrolysing)
MASSTGSSWVTFNGEIYNFRSLRRMLADSEWRSQSDTEVILNAYAAWGRECVERLRGMFAFALWDAHRRELFLARDRLGIKPLYYATLPGGVFAFASEVRALLASGRIPRCIDQAGVWEYLTYQSVPAPRTLVEGVRALPPGHWLVVDAAGRIEVRRYWDLLERAQSKRAPDASDAGSRARLGELLHESVALHLVSDVPVAAFLSGGIDSSAVVTLMRGAGQVPRTFSVGFAEREYDETHYARTVAATCGAEHTEIRLAENEILAQVPEALDAMDQPSGDGVNTFIVSRAVRQAGIKVALSGLGGDELFAGYPSFKRLGRSAGLLGLWGRAPAAVRATAARGALTLGPASESKAKMAAMLGSTGGLATLFPITRQVLSRDQRRGLLTRAWAEPEAGHQDPYELLLHTAFARHPWAGTLTAISYAEARTYMHDVLLRDTDQMSMAHGLEVRVPLLDHELVAYVMGLPDRIKRPNGTPKRLLVETLGGLLPADIVGRRKQGFVLPFDAWLRAQLRSFSESRLAGLSERGLVRADGVSSLWHAFLTGHRGVSWSRPWVLVVLEHWLERNGF